MPSLKKARKARIAKGLVFSRDSRFGTQVLLSMHPVAFLRSSQLHPLLHMPSAPMLALMGHLSRQMIKHYPHIRMAAKREAVEVLNITAKPRGHVKEPPKVRPKPVVQ
jgi:hypothetical protein